MASPLWERERVRAAVTELLDSARSRQGGVLFVEGDAGLGKSSIVEMASGLARPDLTVGIGQGDAMETSLPFGVLEQALVMVGGPSLIQGTRSDRPEQLYRLLRWAETVERGVLVALDDLHWADSDSLEVLALLCRRIAALPVAVVATFRPWPERAREIAAALGGSGVGRLVRLAPLSREVSIHVLAERSGRTVSDDAAARAWELCAGNPLLLEQVALAIASGEIDVEAPGAWTALRTDALLLSRFAGLPPSALRFARAGSVLGARFRPATAAAVAGLTDAEVDDAIEAMSQGGLVEQMSPGAVRFVHPLFAHALYVDLPAPMRTRLHARSFEVLVSQGLDAEAAEHAVRAGLHDAPEVVATLERAGRAALDVGALGTAAAQLRTAVELAAERASTSLLMASGEAQLRAGDPVGASRDFEIVLGRGDLEPKLRAAALRARGRALSGSGEHTMAAASFTQAAELLIVDDAAAAAEALVDQSLSMHIVLGPNGCLPIASRAIGLAGDDHHAARLRAASAQGFLQVLAGEADGIKATAAAVAAVRVNPRPDLADPAWSWGLTSVHAHAAMYLEQFDVAARSFRSVRVEAERSGAAEALTMSLIGEAEVAARRGRLVEALDLSERAGELTELVPLGATYNAVVRFFVLMHLDRVEDADDCCRDLEALLDERDEGMARIWLSHLHGIRHLGLGRPTDASSLYLKAEQHSDQLGIGEPCAIPWAGRAVIAHARAGRESDALRVLGHLAGCAERLPCRYPAVAAAFGRAELALRRADHAASDRHYREALELHDGAELPMERTSTLLAFGQMLRAIGQPAQARRAFADALELANGIGAPALTRFATDGLASVGGRRRRRTPAGQLTPQELRVARLVRTGASRRDIADRLAVSEATIRTHLERIYAKLDIHSARELFTSTAEQLVDEDASA